ncbi:12212_t:CDS:2 [Funneliformis caledonium]|uniref:12212_t:CDS:1 n=1 Tax=Funneliformis caledonium TaxID=1117310 RepID=A0A9N9CLV3_9GLOM|nr:12212_t:CDS:2 [Funneliformis caledonium]
MLKSLKIFKSRKDNICAKPGCNNQVKREKNGTVLNYCSTSCQMNNYAPGSEYEEESWEPPTYTPEANTSNQWGVWTPDNSRPPPYAFEDDDIFATNDRIQVTPLWEPDDAPPSPLSVSRPNPTDDFPIWLGASVDPLWVPPSSDNNHSRYSSSNLTPRSTTPSDDEEIQCPACTFFIRPNKTVCEMCGTTITRLEPKKSHYKSKSTITSFRDLYEEDENEEPLNPFADPIPPLPRRNNNHSSSSNKNDRSNNSNKTNNYERSNYYDYSDYDFFNPRPSPPNDELWIDDYEPTSNRRSRPPPEPIQHNYRNTREYSRRNVQNPQKPPTPPPNDNEITCSACNFNNHPSMTHCEICYSQLIKSPPPEQKNRTTAGGRFNQLETRAKKACSACSYYNDADSVQCEMCYSPIAGVARKTTFNLPSLFKHDVNMTQCPTCTFMNHPSMPQCEMCRNELPGSNAALQQLQFQQYLDNLPGPATKIFNLPLDDHDYMATQQVSLSKKLYAQFFKVGLPNARILAIFRVIMPARLIQAHETYKKQISGNQPANNVTHRMFHGTQVVCDATRLYGNAEWKFCAAVNCGLCGIAQNGNSCAKSKHGGRMWFANTSQTSLGYCRTDPIKAMFVLDLISATGAANGIIIVDKEAHREIPSQRILSELNDNLQIVSYWRYALGIQKFIRQAI